MIRSTQPSFTLNNKMQHGAWGGRQSQAPAGLQHAQGKWLNLYAEIRNVTIEDRGSILLVVTGHG